MPSHHGQQWLDREDVQDVTVVRFLTPHLRGEEDNRTIFHLIASLLETMGRRKLVLNFGKVESMSSDAIGQIVMLNRKVQAAGGRLALTDLRPVVGEAIDTMDLSTVLDIYPSEREALQSFEVLDRKEVGEVTVLTIKPQGVNGEEVGAVFAELGRLMAHRGCRKAVVNFRQVTSLSEPALRDFVRRCEQDWQAAGGRLAVCHLHPDLYEGAERPPLLLYGDEQQAVDSFPP